MATTKKVFHIQIGPANNKDSNNNYENNKTATLTIIIITIMVTKLKIIQKIMYTCNVN